jgi:DNA-directed RNA polymerase subunit F
MKAIFENVSKETHFVLTSLLREYIEKVCSFNPSGISSVEEEIKSIGIFNSQKGV